MKEIVLRGKNAAKAGAIALVDDEDYERLSQYNWHLHSQGYVVANAGGSIVRLHRLLLNFPPSAIDHQDGDPLNNQRYNLRLATPTQNNANRKPQTGCSSRFKGVSWNKDRCKWQAQIKFHGKNRHVGYYDMEIDAAHSYDFYAAWLFKEFARLNFPAPPVVTFRCMKELAQVAA